MKRRVFLRLLASATAGGAAVSLLQGRPSWPRRLARLLEPPEGGLHRRTMLAMGTFVTISVPDEDACRVLPAIERAFEEFRCVDALMSTFDPASQLASVNRRAGERSVRVDARVCEVVAAAVQMGERSGGIFDVTVLPLLRSYGFRDGPSRVPRPEELAEVLSTVDYRRVFVDRRTCEIGIESRHAGIDLGGIAKGYAVDRAAEALRASGVEKAVIDAGGDIFALGAPAGRSGWSIGIQHPLHRDRLAARVCIRDQAVATSGNYENHVTVGQERYGHLIDPRNGRPSAPVLSATVVGATALVADAWSTTVFLMGPIEGSRFVQEHEQAQCLFLARREKGGVEARATSGFPWEGVEDLS